MLISPSYSWQPHLPATCARCPDGERALNGELRPQLVELEAQAHRRLVAIHGRAQAEPRREKWPTERVRPVGLYREERGLGGGHGRERTEERPSPHGGELVGHARCSVPARGTTPQWWAIGAD